MGEQDEAEGLLSESREGGWSESVSEMVPEKGFIQKHGFRNTLLTFWCTRKSAPPSLSMEALLQRFGRRLHSTDFLVLPQHLGRAGRGGGAAQKHKGYIQKHGFRNTPLTVWWCAVPAPRVSRTRWRGCYRRQAEEDGRRAFQRSFRRWFMTRSW